MITASYHQKLNTNKPLWVGVKTGYMVQKNTQIFEGNTMMVEVSVGSNQTGKLKISPQVYLTDNLKKIIPAIKVGINLNAFDKDVAI